MNGLGGSLSASPASALREHFGDRPPEITRKITACVACRKQKASCPPAATAPSSSLGNRRCAVAIPSALVLTQQPDKMQHARWAAMRAVQEEGIM